MSGEKGATYLDKLCHKFYDEPKGHGRRTDYVCRICGGALETHYCEERLYLVKCPDCGTMALVKTANPVDAARVTLARPTLTPQNEPLTIEQLREMDGEPVWCKELKSWALIYTEDGKWEPHLILPDLSPVINFPVKTHNRTYTLYRRPPEREEDT